MRIYQQAASLAWLILGLAVLVLSLRLGIGTMRLPGAGFVSFGAALGLCLLSAVQLFRDSIGPEAADADPPLRHLLRVLPSFLALIAYALLLPRIGYGAATLLLMTVLFWLARPRRPLAALIAAALATLATHLLFQTLLNSQFPTGPWGF